jgi:hypothetical protein
MSLRMLPAFVYRFEAVAVRIENVRCVIARIVVDARTRLPVVRRPCRDCGGIERIHLGLACGNEPDVRRPCIRATRPEPEENATFAPEALEIRMPVGTILAVVVDDMRNAEGRERRLVKRNGGCDILDGNEDVIEQTSPPTSLIGSLKTSFPIAD